MTDTHSTDGYVYVLPPQDYWPGWTTFETEPVQPDLLKHAKQCFRAAGWESDAVQGPFFAGLPTGSDDGRGALMVGLKQHNNGTTFIWSPYELPWLPT